MEISWSIHCHNCWGTCHYMFAKGCGSCTIRFQLYFSMYAWEYLTTFSAWWIGCGGLSFWPACSPDLNPLDFFTCTSQMSHLRDSNRMRHWSSVQDPGSMWHHMTDTWLFSSECDSQWCVTASCATNLAVITLNRCCSSCCVNDKIPNHHYTASILHLHNYNFLH
jgi:hypothetical protein